MEYRDIYDCIKAVNYGNLDFSPDAEEEKCRVLNFPIGTIIDDIIRTHFKKRVEVKPEVEPEEIQTTGQATIDSPDLLNKMTRDGRIKELQTEIKESGGDYDRRWAIPKLEREAKRLKKEAQKIEV